MSAALLVRCACGWETRSSSEDELVAATVEHGRRLHNMIPTREQVLAMLVPAEAGAAEDVGSHPRGERADGTAGR